MPSSRGSSWSRDGIHVSSALASGFFTTSTTWEAHGILGYAIFTISRYTTTILLEKEMATHSSTLAWKISWTEEPGRLQPMGLQRVRHNQATSLHSLHNHWRRKWQPTPVFSPGESHGQRSLAGHGPWGSRELDTAEVTKHACTTILYYIIPLEKEMALYCSILA